MRRLDIVKVFFVLLSPLIMNGCTTDSSPSTVASSQLSAVGFSTPVEGRVRTTADIEAHARGLAVLLSNPVVREHVLNAIASSPYRESKLHYQGYLKELRHLPLTSEEEIIVDSMSVSAALIGALELYIPFTEQRSAWQGGATLQVAALVDDDDEPVSYPVGGARTVLARSVRPQVTTFVLTPAEQSFEVNYLPRAECNPDINPGCADGGGSGGTGGGGQSADTSLYMTRLKISDSYESIFKGAPEFEVHILGPNATADSLRSHQCSGAEAGTPYAFDYNNTDQTWTGNVMLFSKSQLASFHSAYPGKAFRVFVVEDDSETCVLRLDATSAKQLFQTLANVYPSVDAATDSVFNFVKTIKAAEGLLELLAKAASFITTKDDIVGAALEDAAVGQYFSGSNWIIRGPGNITVGHMKLEMKP